MNILIVEDHDDCRDTLALLLRTWGFQVEAHPDGPSAIQAAFAGTFDFALIDLMLPGIAGCQVARQLREIHGAAICLIGVTGYRACTGQRFDHLLLKPLDLDELKRLLTDARKHECSRAAHCC